MKTVFVTGGSGFIGRALVRDLVAAGIEVRALARSSKSLETLLALGAKPVLGDIHHYDILKAGMTGCDVVFHLAAVFEFGFRDWREMEYINVEGARRVFQAALDAGVPKIVYTSTVAVNGDTRGQLVDETYRTEHELDSQYERTKWRAHYDVAVPMIEQGAPIVIVQPSLGYGPNDHSVMYQLMRRFHQRKFPFPFIFGPETRYSLTHVDDISKGHILAAEKGVIGESYILAGPSVSQGDLIDFWARLSGREPRGIRISADITQALIPFFSAMDRMFPLPEIFTPETINTLGNTYIASSAKAKRELGWRPRSLQEGMLETLKAVADDVEEAEPTSVQQRILIGIGGVLFALFLIYWIIQRTKRSDS